MVWLICALPDRAHDDSDGDAELLIMVLTKSSTPASDKEIDRILKKRISGEQVNNEEADAFRWSMLLFLGAEYHKRGWVMEIHFGAVRNNNSKCFRTLGPDTGFDAISNENCMPGLSRLLDTLNSRNCLPKTMVFSLNPNDNEAIVTTLGCFHETGIPGKMQHGTAWWFNDNITGMKAQITNLANMSVLGNFTGMLTDSRSFLSYTRHEYFRRILCNLLGEWVENGEYPADMDLWAVWFRTFGIIMLWSTLGSMISKAV